MKRAAAAIIFLALGLGLNASAEDPAMNFSGRWIFNDEKSDPVARVTPIGRAAGLQTQVGGGADVRTPTGRQAGPNAPAGKVPPAGKIPPGGNAGRIADPGTGGRIGYGIGGGTFDGTTPVANDVPLIMNHTGTELEIANALRVNGMNVPNRESYTLDGKKYEEAARGNAGVEGTREVKASLKKNRIKIEVVNLYPEGRKFRTTREFSLSEDGMTLTVEASSQSAYLLSSQKMVYDKK